MALKLSLVSDVRDFLKGVGKVSDAMEDVADSMDDVAKDSRRLEDKVSDAFKGIGKDADAAGDKIGKSVKDGTRKAGEGLSDFRDEANSTAKESAASFDGSADSIIGSFQEISANAFAGFGPAGAAAGLAMAVGIGMAVTALQDGAEKATAMKEKAVDMVDKIAEAGGDLSQLDLADTIKEWGREVLEDNWITFWADEASTKFQETAKDAKEYGVSTRDAVRAAAGSVEDSRKFLAATADDWQRLSKEIDHNSDVTADGTVTFTEAGRAAQAKRDALSDLRGQAEENIKTTEDAVEIYNIETDAINDTEEAAKAAADAIRDKADATREAAGNAMDLTEAENNWVVTLGQMTKDIAANGRTMDVNTEAGRANRDSLVDLAQAANGYRDSAIAAGDSTASITARAQQARDAFINQAEAAGLSRDAAAKLADSYGLIPANVETLVKASGTEEAKAAIESIPDAKDATVKTTETGSAQAQANIDAVHGKDAAVKTTETGSAQAQANINAVHGKDATVKTTEEGSREAQRNIDDVSGKEVKIDVDDMYTVREVQRRIDGIKGKDVFVNLRIGNEYQFGQEIARITQTRNQYVNVIRQGGEERDN